MEVTVAVFSDRPSRNSRSDARRHSELRPADLIFHGSMNLTSLSNMS